MRSAVRVDFKGKYEQTYTNNGIVPGTVVAAQEFANPSSAKSGFISPILQPTEEMHHICHIIVTSLQVLFTNKVTALTTGLAYVIWRFGPFSRICVKPNHLENIVMYT